MWTKKQQIMPEKQKPHTILDPECHNRALPGKQEVVFICECVSGNPHVQIFKHYSCEKQEI